MLPAKPCYEVIYIYTECWKPHTIHVLVYALESFQWSRTRTLTTTHHSWSLSYKLWGVNCVSKQLAVVLAFSHRWYESPKGLWITVGNFGLSHFIRDFYNRSDSLRFNSTVAYSCLPSFKCLPLSHSSNGFSDQFNLCFTHWILVSCHNFPSFHICRYKWSKTGRYIFRSKRVSLLGDFSICWGNKDCDFMNCVIIFFIWVNLDLWIN